MAMSKTTAADAAEHLNASSTIAEVKAYLDSTWRAFEPLYDCDAMHQLIGDTAEHLADQGVPVDVIESALCLK